MSTTRYTRERTNKRYRLTRRTRLASPQLPALIPLISGITTEIQILEPEVRLPVQHTLPRRTPALQLSEQDIRRATCRTTARRTKGPHSTNSKPIRETSLWTGSPRWIRELGLLHVRAALTRDVT